MKNIASSLNLLLVNYRYFISGGPERYLFNFKELMEKKGHQIIPFSVKHPKNVHVEHPDFFLSPISQDKSSVQFSQIKKSPRTIIKLSERTFYSFEANKKIRNSVEYFKIHIAYLLHFLRWISPSIVLELKKNDIPVVVRLSDFVYICPEAHLLRDGKICELCLAGSLWNSVKYKCVQQSYLFSFLNYLSLLFHKSLKIMDKIDAFVCPSIFTLKKMAQAGFEEKKLFHIPTFIDTKTIIPNYEPGNFMLYFSRISREKGTRVLLNAFEKLQKEYKRNLLSLIIIGQSNDREADFLKQKIDSNKIKNVKILDNLEKKELFSLIKKSAFTLVPSIWYDNMPNVILESFALGKPVVGSNLGSIPELIAHGQTGLLFNPGDADDLAKKIQWMVEHPEECRRMGRKARELIEKEYSPEKHYRQIMCLFKRVLGDRTKKSYL